MNKDILRRQRRAKKTRQKLKTLNMPRLTVHVSLQHVYAQVLTPDGSKVLAQASTLDKKISPTITKTSVNKETAALIGKHIAERALAAGVTKVGFDRSGYKYHGRIKALAEAARASGLTF
jgi:large subunit ribosomal protein L18